MKQKLKVLKEIRACK